MSGELDRPVTQRIAAGAEHLLLCAWAGGAWFAGLIAAPQLFDMMPSAQAGSVAGMMFTSVFWLSLPALGLCLLRVTMRRAAGRWRLDAALAGTALILSVSNEFMLHPWIAAMREGTLPRDQWFGIAHGMSSIFFLVNCILAAVLLLRRR